MSGSRSTSDEDENDIFGKYVASELRSIKETKVRRWIKWSVQNLLSMGQIGAMPSNFHQMPFSPMGSSYSMSPSPIVPSPMAPSPMAPSPTMNSFNYTMDSDTS